MDLKQFVTETLVQISEGIEEAQRQLKERGSAAIVNTNMTKTDVTVQKTRQKAMKRGE